MRRKRIKIVLLVLLSWFILHEVIIITDGLRDEDAQAQVAVIFGNTVNVDGTVSARLKARLDKGIELYENGTVVELFVSGGHGSEGHLEGDVMAKYLLSNMIPAEAITIDNQGKNTQLTGENFVKQFPNVESVVLVSQYHHISRAKLTFRKLGVKHAYGAHCDYFEWRDIYSCTREFFAYYKYLIVN